ncbi:hypothetical protein A4X20_00005, partial [Mycolicibacterium iranicum]
MGALAVSLGVGFAVANSAGVAYADVDADTSASAESDSEPRTKASSTKPSSRTDTEDTESPDPGSSDSGSVAEELSETEDVEDPVEEEVEEEEAADDLGEASSPETHSQDDDLTSVPDESDIPDAAAEVIDTPAPPPYPEEADVAEEVVAPDAGGVAPTQNAETDVVPVEVATPATSAESVVSAAPEDSTASVDVMTAVVSSVLSPFTNPATPARAPWFDAVLAWVRRQIVHTFFNESPEWGPVEAQQIGTGQVLIDLKARDPNGDPLTYSIVQPSHGVVFRDPLTGKFVYTPTTVVTGTPLQDSFTVTISDSSEHLKGPLGVVQGVFHFLRRAAGIAEPDEVTLMVPVTVNPVVEIPPIVVTLPVAAGTPGNPVAVSPVVVITDLDSDEMTSATVTLSDAADGDVLGYGTLPTGVTVTTGVGSLTFAGAASTAAYQQLLASVTLTTRSAAIRTVSFTVTDDQDLDSIAAATVVTVLGLPVDLPPLVVTSPVAVGTAGSAVVVSPIVVITDLDSDEISAAEVKVNSPEDGDVLSYGPLPDGVVVSPGDGLLTFTGTASVDAYQQLLASVTLTSQGAGIKSVSFTVTDDEGLDSVPVATVVTMLGLPIEVPPLVVTTPIAAGTAGSVITVSPVVVITDFDSEQLSSATVTISNASGGDTLAHGTLPPGVTATVADGSVTFTGLASVSAYQQLLASVTMSSPTAAIKTVSFTVTDNQGLESASAATVVTVLGLPVEVPPLVVTSPVAVGTAGGSVQISPIVIITDLDSDELGSATVIVENYSAGDVLGYGTLPDGVAVATGDGSVSFTGAASVAAYQQLLASVTLTSPAAGIKTISFSVTDDQGLPSIPVGTVVTLLGLPAEINPLVVTTPVSAGVAGSDIAISPVVVIADLDSDELASATVTINDAVSGDVLAFGILPTGVTATIGNGSVTFAGIASVADYQQLLASVTLTSSSAGIKSVSFIVIDDQGLSSPAAGTIVTVLGVSAQVPPLVVTTPVAAGTVGNVTTISPIVVITDLDSDEIDSATVTIDNPVAGDVLGYGSVPTGITVSAGANSVTFTGAASVVEYQLLLQSVTLTSTTPGIRSVSFVVTDDQGNESEAAGTLVTVVGLSVQVPPLVVTTPVAAGIAGGVITVSPVVIITDLDSQEIDSATVTLDNPVAGDVLGYGSVPTGITVSTGANSVTFTGAASVVEYQLLLQSVTLTSTTPGIRSVSFVVTDDQGNESEAAGTLVTVVGLSVQVPPLVVTTPVAAGTAGGVITVSPVVIITDLDSDELDSATVTIDNPAAGDVLGYGSLPTGVVVTTGANSVTFTGAASVVEYQQLLQSVTLTSQMAGIRSVSFTVTDDQGNESQAAGTLVTVVGLSVQVPPLVVTTPVAAGTAGGVITVSPVVIITDLDSGELDSATLTLGNPEAGDVLGYGSVPTGVVVTAGANSVTFTGAASVAEYQQLLQSVTLTSQMAGIRSVSFTVTDDQGNASAAAGTLVTVVGVPASDVTPLVVALPVAAGTAGGVITVSPVVIITDLDSGELDSATVTIDNPAAGDVLSYGSLPTGVVVSTGANSVTFTGPATVVEYQQLLQSVTLTSTAPGIRLVSFVVTDDQGNESEAAGTLVTVVGLSVQVPPLVVTTPVAAGTAGGVITVSPVVIITDLDSQEIDSATVTLDNPEAGDVLGYGSVPTGVVVSAGANSVTFTGAATVVEYQQLLQSVTLTSTTPGIRSVSFVVTDDQGNQSAAAGTLATVVGLPASDVTPLVVALPVAAGTTGTPTVVSPVIVIADLDSDEIDSATVTLSNPEAGDVLGYGSVPTGVVVTTGANSVTFTGAATVVEYQQLLQSVTLTSTTPGIRSVSFVVTDDQGNESEAAGTLVTVVGLSVQVPPLVVTTPVAAGTAGGVITVSPVVIITDLDSQEIDSATVTLDNAEAGDVLGYGSVPTGITVSTGANSVTFTGAATVVEYQQLLQSVTLTSQMAGIRSVSFTVTDDQGNASAAAGTLVTVVGVPASDVTPLVVALPVAAGTTGAATVVSAVVVIADLDSDELDSATVTIENPEAGDVLGYGSVPTGVVVTTGANSVTFTGAASVVEYQQLLQSVTLTSQMAGIRSVSFTVTDDQGNASAAAGTLVTVVGLPANDVTPLVVALPVAAGTAGTPTVVSAVVVIADLDSDELDSATVTIDNPTAGDVLSYGSLPTGVVVSTGANSVTFTGAASLVEYQQLLQSVTLTSTTAGIRSVSFVVTDDQGNASAAAGTLVTVVGLPASDVMPLVVALPVAAGTTGTSTVVSAVVVIADLDSDEFDSATVTIENPEAGDVLGYGSVPTGVVVTAGANSVTFTGAASVVEYQQLLQSVTLTSTTPGIRSVSFTVTDDQGNESEAAATAVTVVGLPAEVTPLVVGLPIAAGTTGSATVVSAVVVIADLDSDEIDSATVTITNPAAGDVLGYGSVPTGIIVTAGANSVTFTGAATVAEYQQLLQSVTLTSTTAGIRSVSFTVTDDQGNESEAAATAVTVVGLPAEVTPLVVALPIAAGTTGSATVVSAVVVIADLDSDEIDSATVTIDNPAAGDVLGYGSVPTGIIVTAGANSVTFTGAATVVEYQQLLQSVTLTSTTAGIRSVSFTVTDDQGNESEAAATAVTVVGLPAEVTPLVVALPVAAGTTGSATVVSAVVVIADLDSDEIDSATVTIDNPAAGDVLGYGSVPTGITVSTGANSV